ncbi:MAG: FAD-dependent oxidoreductase [Eubacterium sp.]|nr:FAD-dependent oxidoreductase [Eubacterium sp.]
MEENRKESLDVLIIGSGPAGLCAAVYAKRANLEALVLEKEYLGTGQITESDQVDNYLGLPEINGFDLGEAFRGHALGMGVAFQDGMADGFEKEADGWSVHVADGRTIRAKTVIYCAGASHRRLGVEGEQELTGKGVSYCAVCDGAFYRGKETAVIGGGDTALGDAMYLSDLCEKVYLIHRRKEFRGSAQTVQQLREKENVEIITEAVPARISGEQTVTALELKDGRTIPVDGAFVAVGMQPQTQYLQGVVDLDANGYIIADETGSTSAPGFFAAGDVRTKALRQVITAVSDGANAAVSAAAYIRSAKQPVDLPDANKTAKKEP